MRSVFLPKRAGFWVLVVAAAGFSATSGAGVGEFVESVMFRWCLGGAEAALKVPEAAFRNRFG
jgi:hypothetical protein